MISYLFIFDAILLLLVVMTAIAVVEVKDLFASTMLAGLYSLLMAMVWTNMHAVDVAFTESAVGAGISTILLIGALVITGRQEKKVSRVKPGALLVVILTGAALIYGTLDMPAFGDTNAPLHQHRAKDLLTQTVGKVHRTRNADGTYAEHPYYTEAHTDAHAHAHQDDHGHGHHESEIVYTELSKKNDFFIHGTPHIPNTVSSLLADYRGFDTMMETAVILTAGLGMLILLRRREEDPEPTMDTAHHPTIKVDDK